MSAANAPNKTFASLSTVKPSFFPFEEMSSAIMIKESLFASSSAAASASPCDSEPANSEPGNTSSVKPDPNDTSLGTSQFSLDFQSFSSLEEATKCLQIANDIASLEGRSREISHIKIAKETMKLRPCRKVLDQLKRALVMSEEVYRILRLVNSLADREAARKAIKYIEGLEKLELQVKSLSNEAQQEMYRAYRWLNGAYRADTSGSLSS